jgi:hypothetical protein
VAVPKCPICRAELTDKQVKTIQGTYAQSKRTVRAGGRPLSVRGVIARLDTVAEAGPVNVVHPRRIAIESRGKS